MNSRLHQIHAWLLLLPALALLALFTHWPAVATFVDSFYSTPKARRPSVFVGPDNYTQMLSDPVFWQAAWNNLWFAIGTIPVSIALALLMATWVNDRFPGRTPQYGLLEQIRGAFGAAPINWLGSRDTALLAVTIVAVWKEAGFFMIFYLAALQAIPPNLAEAAALEGASRWHFFRRVQFPLLMPTTLFVLINAVINAFRTVDHIVVLTRGGPDNATTLLLYHIYTVGFSFWDTGYAAAITVVLLAILAGLALIQYGVLERRIHYR
jgi:sn-glycerol 3-phosphate transport system permease protein